MEQSIMKSKLKLSSILIKSCLLASTALSFSFAAPQQQPCPAEVKDLPAETTCWSGQDEAVPIIGLQNLKSGMAI